MGAIDAKTHLPRLLDEVERGVDIAAVIREMRSLRQEISLEQSSLRDIIESGRRF